MMKPMGLYFHIPLCDQKCPYCDFYSLPAARGKTESVTAALLSQIIRYAPLLRGRVIDSVYFGGGTPPLLGTDNLLAVIKAAREHFLLRDPEITMEVNPASIGRAELSALARGGVNRISIGMQSGIPLELAAIGRRHTVSDVLQTAQQVKEAGIANFSLDLMLGLPGQTEQSLRETLQIALSQNPVHLSAYLLKIEKGTPFFSTPPEVPDEDAVCDLYETAHHILQQNGYPRYEISNFSKKGAECRHNLHYWRCDEYLGLGPSAHSFLNGRRFFYPRSLNAFTGNADPVDDGPGGGFEETVMLGLRLTEGIDLSSLTQEYPTETALLLKNADILAKQGFVYYGDDRLSLCDRSVLISNAIIGKLLFG